MFFRRRGYLEPKINITFFIADSTLNIIFVLNNFFLENQYFLRKLRETVPREPVWGNLSELIFRIGCIKTAVLLHTFRKRSASVEK